MLLNGAASIILWSRGKYICTHSHRKKSPFLIQEMRGFGVVVVDINGKFNVSG